MKRHWSEDLPPDACGEAVDWCKTQSSPEVAWKKCEDGGWMVWLLLRRRIKNSKKKLRLLVADIAESVFDLVQDDHKLAAAWAIGAARRSNIRECEAAANAAYAAADAATYAAYAAGSAYKKIIADLVREYFPHPPRLKKEEDKKLKGAQR